MSEVPPLPPQEVYTIVIVHSTASRTPPNKIFISGTYQETREAPLARGCTLMVVGILHYYKTPLMHYSKLNILTCTQGTISVYPYCYQEKEYRERTEVYLGLDVVLLKALLQHVALQPEKPPAEQAFS